MLLRLCSIHSTDSSRMPAKCQVLCQAKAATVKEMDGPSLHGANPPAGEADLKEVKRYCQSLQIVMNGIKQKNHVP